MPSPSLDQFVAAAADNRLLPLRRRIPADLETPVSAFLKLRGADDPTLHPQFLLESVEQGLQVGRYTFIGVSAAATLTLRDGTVAVDRNGTMERHDAGDDPLHFIRDEIARTPALHGFDLPGPFAGAVGYIGYEVVRYFERIPIPEDDGLGLPDYLFVVPRSLVVFDHVRSEIELVVLPAGGAPAEAYRNASAEIDRLLGALASPLKLNSHGKTAAPRDELASNMPRQRFEEIVAAAREHILAGDALQIVLSQRFEGRAACDPFQVYRALRILNPSPYMFFFDFGEFELIGSSPEVLVRLDGRTATLAPIAGTSPRGDNPTDDERLAHKLLEDEKERAEHVMLVDLGRNDLGRVCDTGTVHVRSLMHIERYSHVMHIVSTVTGTLRDGSDGFDLLRASFPAGTVSGAPKIRAMQIVAALESERRGPYAGAVGYFGHGGEMDMCITIRTIVMKGNEYYVQAGAGVVADSDPAREFDETVNKARALIKSITIAEEGL